MVSKRLKTKYTVLAACAVLLSTVYDFAPIADATESITQTFKMAQDTSGEQDRPENSNTVLGTGEIDIPQPSSTSKADESANSVDKKEVVADHKGLIENINKPEAPPAVYSDLEKLPFPARKMHELILNAARTGDIEKLRPFIGHGDDVTMLSLGGFDEDPIEFLKSISGDADGHELLAIITEILESNFVLLDEGTDREVYVWPYFYAYPLENLTPKQRVQLFRIMTYGDYQEMESFGAYIFYRLGITPKGRWRFFVAGD